MGSDRMPPRYCAALTSLAGAALLLFGYHKVTRSRDASIEAHRLVSGQWLSGLTAPLEHNTLEVKSFVSTPKVSFGCAKHPASNKGRYIYVVTDVHRDSRYALALRLSITTLLRTCPVYGITVLWNQDFAMMKEERHWFEERDVEVRLVAPIYWDGRAMSTTPTPWSDTASAAGFFKLNVWALRDWERVAVVDADIIVLRSIDSIFTECHAQLCATREWAPAQANDTQWNAGFFITKPKAGGHTIDTLLHSWVNFTAGHLPYMREQWAFNRLFPHTQILGKELDVQFCNTQEELRQQLDAWNLQLGQVRALHVKFWKMPFSYLQWAVHGHAEEQKTGQN